MENGGQIFRTASNTRFYYKIEDGKIMCRCNELGGWHPAIAEPRLDTDVFEIADIDWDSYKYDTYTGKTIGVIKNLPSLE